jgi:hypothetical protein
MPPLVLPGFRSSAELNDVIVYAMRTVDVYPDMGTKAEILVPAIRAAKLLERRSRCCRRHRAVAWLIWLNLLCMRQFFLRCSWRNDGLGAGSTIWFWRGLGVRVAKLTDWFRLRSPGWMRPSMGHNRQEQEEGRR